MYHIKPIISSAIHIEYPTSMYKIKPISTDRLNENQNINLNVVGSKLADVSENSCKKSNRDIEQQINNILKVHFEFQSIIFASDSDQWVVKQIVFLFQQSKGSDHEMEELEARQETILRHLKELKERLMSMHKELTTCSKPAQSRAQQPEKTRTVQKPIDVKLTEA